MGRWERSRGAEEAGFFRGTQRAGNDEVFDVSESNWDFWCSRCSLLEARRQKASHVVCFIDFPLYRLVMLGRSAAWSALLRWLSSRLCVLDGSDFWLRFEAARGNRRSWYSKFSVEQYLR
ncbi:MAG: hypothetical protein ACKESB_03165 [Candidatus Hodgkinia cicadicola]